MSEIDSPNVLKIKEATKTLNNYYLALEYCNGGDLKNYVKKRGGRLPEQEARLVFKQIVKGMSSMHAKNMIHRDVKLANILCQFTDYHEDAPLDNYIKFFDFETNRDSLVVKIADLGFSRKLQQGQVAETGCGTPLTMAPEIFFSKTGYGNKVDIWSLGCIFFELLTGLAPFRASS